jgi:O-antigen/teichoic acid export membrane protein
LNSKEIQPPTYYKQIVKATSIFGGVQIINILVSITRTKFIAILLGPSGVGIIGILTSTVNLMNSLTNLGLNFSSVRSISIAKNTNDITTINRCIITLRRWILIAGIIGMVLAFLFSRQLSIWSFGNEKYSWAFIWLSITILLQSLTSGQLAILQGMSRLRELAISNIISSLVGLTISIPMFYWLGMKGIVPSIICVSIFAFLTSWNFVRKIETNVTYMTFKESFNEGFQMVRLGITIMITNFALIGVMYFIQVFINRSAGMDKLGIFVAANTILTGYIGLVFSSMLPDYLPRLSAVSDDRNNTLRLVNQQTELALIFLGPILILLLSFLPIIINILYNSKFTSVISLLQWAIPGVLFMAINWTTGIMIIAKGNFKLFILLEIISDLFILFINITLFNILDLDGLGIAYLANHFFRFIIQFSVLRLKYTFSFEKKNIKIFIIQILLVLSAFFIVKYSPSLYKYLLLSFIIIASLLYSFNELKVRISLNDLIKKNS